MEAGSRLFDRTAGDHSMADVEVDSMSQARVECKARDHIVGRLVGCVGTVVVHVVDRAWGFDHKRLGGTRCRGTKVATC